MPGQYGGDTIKQKRCGNMREVRTSFIIPQDEWDRIKAKGKSQGMSASETLDALWNNMRDTLVHYSNEE